MSAGSLPLSLPGERDKGKPGESRRRKATRLRLLPSRAGYASRAAETPRGEGRMRTSVVRSAAAAVALAVSFGCSAATEPGGPSNQAKATDSLTITPSTLTLAVGESSHLLAR